MTMHDDPRLPHASGVGSNATWQAPTEALPKPQPGDAVGLCAVDRTYHPIEELMLEPTGLVVCRTDASDDASILAAEPGYEIVDVPTLSEPDRTVTIPVLADEEEAR